MRVNRRRIAATSTVLVAGLALAACSSDADGGDGEVQETELLMNWFAQAEQGGYWQADAEDLAADDGVNITVRQGGPQIQTIPQVASGEADFGIAQGDELLLARAEGAPVVLVFGGMDTYLQCLMFHPSAGIEDWPDLDGFRVAVAPSGGFWDYIKGHYDLQDVQEVNFTGSMANFAGDETMVQQCFITSEPYVAEQEGIEIETMLIADSGYNPYSQGLFTTEETIENDPELVRAVVAAAQQGWENFLADPTAGTELILETNSDMEEEKITFAHEELSDGYFADTIGSMTAERWETMEQQLREAGVLTKDVDVSEVWTDEFLP